MNKKDKILTFLLSVYILMQPLIPTNSIKIRKVKVSGDLALVLIFLVYIVNILISEKSRNNLTDGIKDFFKDYLSLSMFLLALIMFVSISYASDKKIALSESIRFSSYVVLYFIIKYECNNKKIYNIMLQSYIAVCGILSVFGIYQYFTGIGLARKFKYSIYASERISSTMDNPNNLAAFIILAIFPLIMISIYEKNKIRKIYFSLVTCISFICLVLSSSRSAYLGFGIGLIALAVVYNWKFIFIFLFGSGFAFLIPKVSMRIKAVFDPAQDNSRISLWKVALKMIKDHPVLGVGNGNYASLYDAYVKRYPELKYPDFKKYPTHNSYLKVESELGILGIISFLSMLMLSVNRVKKLIDECNDKFYKFFYTGFIASMIAFYCMNFVDNLFFVPKTTVFFWILLAISQGILYRKRYLD